MERVRGGLSPRHKQVIAAGALIGVFGAPFLLLEAPSVHRAEAVAVAPEPVAPRAPAAEINVDRNDSSDTSNATITNSIAPRETPSDDEAPRTQHEQEEQRLKSAVARRAQLAHLHPGIVKSRYGARARVAARHTTKFQCLVDWLDDEGFRIVAMTGYAQRAFGGSLHPIGAAIDIDQSRRNYLTRGKRFPEGVNEAASRCGLLHGDRTVWKRHPDYGHFQVAGVSRGWHRRRAPQQPSQIVGISKSVFGRHNAQAAQRSGRTVRTSGVAATSINSAQDVK
jgi:hypothetical protein